MTQDKMRQTRTLRVDKVFVETDEGHSATLTIERDVVLEYSDNVPNRLYLKITDPNKVGGALNSYSIYEVEKLKKYINQVYLLMKENRDGDGSNL
ncbi:MAG TPA: hypothetical protein DCP70_15455 [Alteromonas macleodii]|nr:hypothetical protein [Alteromonas macleodii]|tara:strand:+ start:570 stop:854 length:285 start_codon:yes stop_codon:yes gene_type:complete